MVRDFSAMTVAKYLRKKRGVKQSLLAQEFVSEQASVRPPITIYRVSGRVRLSPVSTRNTDGALDEEFIGLFNSISAGLAKEGETVGAEDRDSHEGVQTSWWDCNIQSQQSSWQSHPHPQSSL